MKNTAALRTWESAPDEVRQQMRAAETPRWIGYPIPGKFAIKTSMPIFLFAIPWTAFAIFWEWKAMKSPSILFPMFGIPFLVIGFYQLSSPLRQYWQARRTIYVVSNQRLLILAGLLRPSAKSFAPSDIGPLKVETSNDGSGSVVFSERRTSDGEGGWNVEKIGFIAIPRVREAEEQIVLLKKSEAGGPV